jgi:hypothetical protein
MTRGGHHPKPTAPAHPVPGRAGWRSGFCGPGLQCPPSHRFAKVGIALLAAALAGRTTPRHSICGRPRCRRTRKSDEVYQRYVKYLTGCAELFRNGFTDVCQFTLERCRPLRGSAETHSSRSSTPTGYLIHRSHRDHQRC